MREAVPTGVPWRDLTRTTRWTALREMLHPLPWLFASIALYAAGLWPLGLIGSFVFFLCALRLNHEAIHSNLGLSRRGDSAVLLLLSVLMMGSNHSVAYGHLRHHADTMGPGDFEGKAGRMGLWQVLAYGPRFPIDILMHGWAEGGPKWRRRIALDLAAIALWLGAVLVLALWLHWPAFLGAALLWHVAAMAVAQCLTAFFAVWITHHGCEEAGIVARSQRGPLAFLAYMMFYHREHHLFPKVPVSRLPDLARRLDAGAAGYADQHLPIVPLWEAKAP